jgi:hypothetical protein
LIGCKPNAQWYTLPPQRAEEPIFVAMRDRRANDHIVRDIDRTDRAEWRWTNQRPELRFTLKTVANLKLAMDFIINEKTFAQTGPVTVTFYVNDHLLAKHRYAGPGPQHFEQPVPAEWLKLGDPTLVAAAVDKPYIAPADGVKLGFLLTRAGFVATSLK